ncbi:MAG TPA: Rieske 2Fe-2S domain-containing protein, partial [Candidatus Limnocylindrales bacterium]|nr:Rieske 2Fe-2S domain-containing protein [Candidatus Limnocylindrales bacterium]
VDERRVERIVLALFGVTAVCGLALLVVYILGGQTQIEGLLLFGALGALGAAIVVWAQRLIPARIHIEAREPVSVDPRQMAELQETLTEEAGFSRRRLLVLGLGGALASLAAALAIPVFSLGPAPGRSLFITSWRAGRRLATDGGPPVVAADLPVGGVLTVFPDGDNSDPNAATLLIRIGPSDEGASAASPPPTTAPPAADEFVALSKICTHAGCPVGLYRSSEHVLICPCHQSEFDVLDGARPINGPAARPLPALPFRLEADGTFTALGDFPEPVGPSFWDMHL